MPHNETRKPIQISTPSTGEEEWQALRESVMSGWLTQGPKVREFEQAFSARHSVEHAIATTSCTTALHLALEALGVTTGDEVIVPAFTWVATANVVRYCGATPVFADVDPATYNIDPASVSNVVTDRTKAVIGVHLFGQCFDFDAVREAADGIAIVEDAACAAGASYKGQPAGSLGELGCFSFHPRKSITTGEGGMVTTNNPELAERVNMLRNHGAAISEEQRHHGPRPYLLPDFDEVGFNYRMTDLQGAIGTVQLKKLDGFLDERREWANWYSEQLEQIDWIRTPAVPAECEPAWQAYVTMIDESRAPMPRNEIMARLQDRGISTRPGTHAVHMLGCYRDGLKPEDFPGSLQCDRQTMAIPLHNRMSSEDYHYIVREIKAVETAAVRAA